MDDLDFKVLEYKWFLWDIHKMMYNGSSYEEIAQFKEEFRSARR